MRGSSVIHFNCSYLLWIRIITKSRLACTNHVAHWSMKKPFKDHTTSSICVSPESISFLTKQTENVQFAVCKLLSNYNLQTKKCLLKKQPSQTFFRYSTQREFFTPATDTPCDKIKKRFSRHKNALSRIHF